MPNQSDEAKKQREEEVLTGYPDASAIEKYEFKILRSIWGSFKNPEKRDEILRQEAEHGWRFLEKFDDSRIRVYRKRGARTSEANGIDPYRTLAGGPSIERKGVPIAIILTLVFLLAGGIGMYFYMRQMKIQLDSLTSKRNVMLEKIQMEFEKNLERLKEDVSEQSAVHEKKLQKEYEKARVGLEIEIQEARTMNKEKHQVEALMKKHNLMRQTMEMEYKKNLEMLRGKISKEWESREKDLRIVFEKSKFELEGEMDQAREMIRERHGKAVLVCTALTVSCIVLIWTVALFSKRKPKTTR